MSFLLAFRYVSPLFSLGCHFLFDLLLDDSVRPCLEDAASITIEPAAKGTVRRILSGSQELAANRALKIVLPGNAPVSRCIGHVVPERQQEQQKEQSSEDGLEWPPRKTQPEDSCNAK
jgi:hypothetical protein